MRNKYEPKRKYMQPGRAGDGLKFIVVAIIFMVLMDKFMFHETKPYVEEARKQARAEAIEEYQVLQEQANLQQTVPEEYHDITEDIVLQTEAPVKIEVERPEPIHIAKVDPQVKIPENSLDKKSDSYVPLVTKLPKSKAPRVVIVIDDLGVSRKYTHEVIALPGPLTLAFLPYPDRVDELVDEAKRQGHEIIIHFPMEPMNGDLDTGDIVLRTDQSPEEFDQMLEEGFNAFDGYIGINNHMGSRLTQDKGAMERVMQALKERNLAFLDSRTISTSVAAETAEQYGVPYAVRDVFLDHDPSLEGVHASLKKVEEVVAKYGYAIAIGHPKPNTIQALSEWLPKMEEEGVKLVPLSEVLITKQSVASQDAVSDVPSQSQAQPHQ